MSSGYYLCGPVYLSNLRAGDATLDGFSSESVSHHLQNVVQVALLHQICLVHHNQICHPNLRSAILRRTALAWIVKPVSANHSVLLRHLDRHFPSFESDNSWSPPQSPHHPSRPLKARRGDTSWAIYIYPENTDLSAQLLIEPEHGSYRGGICQPSCLQQDVVKLS